MRSHLAVAVASTIFSYVSDGFQQEISVTEQSVRIDSSAVASKVLRKHLVLDVPLESEVQKNSSRISSRISYLFHRIRHVVPDHFNYIAVNATYHNIWEEIATMPQRRPRIVNLWLGTVKTWAADLVVQLSTFAPDGRNLVDWRRSAAFAIFGFLYIGLVQWILYVTLFSQVFPRAITFANEPFNAKMFDKQGQLDLVKQVISDNFFINPFIYFPVFYCIKGCIQKSNKPQEESDIREQLGRHLRVYQGNFLKDNLCSMAVWIPGDVFIYSFAMYLRMPMEHSLAFLWTMVLSYFRGAPPSAGGERLDKQKTSCGKPEH